MKYIITDSLWGLSILIGNIDVATKSQNDIQNELMQLYKKNDSNPEAYQIRNYIQREVRERGPVLPSPLCRLLPPAIDLKGKDLTDVVNFKKGDKIVKVTRVVGKFYAYEVLTILKHLKGG